MARYIMANRRAGKFREAEKSTARASIALAMSSFSPNVNVQGDNDPSDPLARRIVRFEADPAQIQQMAANLPSDVILEPEILHYRSNLSPFGFSSQSGASVAASFDTGTGNTLKIKVTGSGKPLKGTDVLVFFRGAGGLETSQTGTTNSQGRVTFEHSNFWTPSAAVASPADAFWATVAFGPSGDATIECAPLPENGPLEWWHKTVGITSFQKTRGKGVRVGVIDTGIGPHAYLDHVTDIGAFVGGTHDANGADVDSHGSHVTGTIGGRPTKAGDYAGIAPGTNIFSARVFPDADNGAANDDIANAIDALSREHKCDLINMSLGAPVGSAVIKDAIIDAAERGTLCICAAGNSGGSVEFPAAFDAAVAVSAIGLVGWGPAGSMPTFRLPQDPQKFGDENLFLANFSCFGPNIDCAGPGVGILATVPERHGFKAPYSSMGGTSMASPVVCGTAATVLSKSSAYKATNRDETRSQLARKLLLQSGRSIGLKTDFQGAGVPTAP